MNWYAMTHDETQETYDTMAAKHGITSIDLCHEAATLEWYGTEFETARLAPPEDAHGTEYVDVLYVPSSDRAGVAWGSDAVWFDATSIEDAYAQFFAP